MELGLITFGSLLPDPATGVAIGQTERLREVVDAGTTAEELGFAWYTIGEHHFGENDVIPSPALVLAAVAERTSTIRLATGTTLVANRDPVLVAEDYALLDQLSEGRLELIAGGSFFPAPYTVFGQDPASKAERKREGVELLIRLWTEERVTWSGRYRPDLHNVRLQPRLSQDRPPLWISGGTRRDSVRLAVEHGLPMVFGTVGGAPSDWRPAFALYRRLWAEHGHAGPPGRTGAASHTFVARTTQEARSKWADYAEQYYRTGDPTARLDLDAHAGPGGPALCGSPAEVVDKIGTLREQWGHDLHLLAIDLGGIPAAEVAAATELVASDVLPQLAVPAHA